MASFEAPVVTEDTAVDVFFSSETIASLDLELETGLGPLDTTSCTVHCC